MERPPQQALCRSLLLQVLLRRDPVGGNPSQSLEELEAARDAVSLSN